MPNFPERSFVMGRKQRLKREKKAAVAAEELQPIKRNSLFWTVFVGLCVLMLYPPFLRGLFFTREFLPTHAYSAVLFALWWLYKLSVNKDTSFLSCPLDYAVLGIMLAYALSFVPAVNKRAALGELLKNTNYFIAFWMAAQMTKELKKPQLMLNILLANAALVALLGLGAAAGTFKYPGAFSGTRIYSSLQYPNTLATYTTAALFISMTLFLNCPDRWGRYLYPGINFTLLLVFILTYSRGAWLAFPLILVLYLIGISRGKKVTAFAGFVLTLIPTLLCLQGFSSAITGGHQLKAWLWYFFGVALTIGLAQLSIVTLGYLKKLNKEKLSVVIGIGSATFIALAVILYRLIPESIIDRLSKISLEQSSAGSRLEFYRDAFKIIKDYPIFGAGGGGWQALYQGYQSRLYWTTEVHSYFLQLWIETGTLGFLILCTMGVILAYGVFKFVRDKEAEPRAKDYVWGAFIGAFALAAHSLIDFNLSLGAVALFLWLLIGIIQGGISLSIKEPNLSAKPIKQYDPIAFKYYLFGILPALLIAVLSLSLLMGEIKAKQAGEYLLEGELSKGIEAYETASRLDPLNSTYRVERAMVLELLDGDAQGSLYTEKARKEYERALKHDRYNAKNHSVMGFFYLEIGEAEKGFEHIERAIELHPYLIDYYEETAFAYRNLVEYMIENKNPEGASEYIQSTLDIAKDLRSLNDRTTSKTAPMEMTYGLLTDLEKLAFMGKDVYNKRVPRMANRIIFATTQMFDSTDTSIPDFWKLGNSEGGDIKTCIKEDSGEQILRLENPGEGRGYVYTKNFALQPDDWYLLTFKARGSVDPSNFRVYIRSRSGEGTQGSLTSVKVSEEWQEYELEFLTTKDIEAGNQYIRIDHRGNDSGYFEIKDIILQW